MYSLSGRFGKMSLLIAFILQTQVVGIIFFIVNGSLSHAIDLFESTRNTSYIYAVASNINIYKLLNAIPAIAFAAAYYMQGIG